MSLQLSAMIGIVAMPIVAWAWEPIANKINEKKETKTWRQ